MSKHKQTSFLYHLTHLNFPMKPFIIDTPHGKDPTLIHL